MKMSACRIDGKKNTVRVHFEIEFFFEEISAPIRFDKNCGIRFLCQEDFICFYYKLQCMYRSGSHIGSRDDVSRIWTLNQDSAWTRVSQVAGPKRKNAWKCEKNGNFYSTHEFSMKGIIFCCIKSTCMWFSNIYLFNIRTYEHLQKSWNFYFWRWLPFIVDTCVRPNFWPTLELLSSCFWIYCSFWKTNEYILLYVQCAYHDYIQLTVQAVWNKIFQKCHLGILYTAVSLNRVLCYYYDGHNNNIRLDNIESV